MQFKTQHFILWSCQHLSLCSDDYWEATGTHDIGCGLFWHM